MADTPPEHAQGLQPGDRLTNFDFATHNAEGRELWAVFNQGKAPRVPIILGTNTRYFVFNDASNPSRLEFKAYIEDPDVMFDAQLQFQRWTRFNLLQDFELGLPVNWTICPDFQNFYEAAFFGCPLEYINGQVPDTMPVFAENPERMMERGIPDPFSGIMGKALAYYEHYKERAAHEEFLGRSIEASVPYSGLSTDGPFTVACNLISPDVACLMMMEEPERLATLLEFITESTIRRMRAWRELAGLPIPQDNFGMADDSIAMISTPMYREHILPYHRRFYETFGTPVYRGIHLCGDATRHFPTICQELNVTGFDTGFPVDFGALRKALGPGIKIQGGPQVDLLLRAKPDAVRAETRRILESGILEGRRFVLREGNNLAPYTPLENTEAMYAAGREFGTFDFN